jgi:hypothetical protein
VKRLAILALLVLAGCEDTVPVWQLDNDRIIAVRATPPHIPAGASATFDALVTKMGEGPSVELPSAALAAPTRPDLPVSPALMAAVTYDGGQWTVTAPSEEILAQLRTELGLMATDPVPILVGLQFDFAPGPLYATKTVMLGDTGDNPVLGDVTVGGAPAMDGMTIPTDTDVALHATAGETDEVDWLTSVGELSDEDDADAILNHDTTVDPPSLTSGHIAVVKRDEGIGVTWGYWTISVAP